MITTVIPSLGTEFQYRYLAKSGTKSQNICSLSLRHHLDMYTSGEIQAGSKRIKPSNYYIITKYPSKKDGCMPKKQPFQEPQEISNKGVNPHTIHQRRGKQRERERERAIDYTVPGNDITIETVITNEKFLEGDNAPAITSHLMLQPVYAQ